MPARWPAASTRSRDIQEPRTARAGVARVPFTRRLRPRTRETYAAQLRLHVLPRLGGLKLSARTPHVIRDGRWPTRWEPHLPTLSTTTRRSQSSTDLRARLERVTRIELAFSAWEIDRSDLGGRRWSVCPGQSLTRTPANNSERQRPRDIRGMERPLVRERSGAAKALAGWIPSGQRVFVFVSARVGSDSNVRAGGRLAVCL